MLKYTVGIYFDINFKKILLILKNRPSWQKGKYNFPGGHTEINENGIDCIIREFNEECNIKTINNDWKYIGIIRNNENYIVDIFTSIQNIEHGEIKTMEDEKVSWFDIDNLPKNIIPNLSWIIPFAYNYWNQNITDKLKFGIFEYEN